ncbi:DUF3152 domain-containing protein [Streptomyces sp. NPDC002845]
MPRFPDGTPAQGVPRFPDGTPAHGVPRFPDGTPAHGVPRYPDGTPAHGVPRYPDGTPAHGTPRVRSGHPEQREPGGGWGQAGGEGRPMGAGPGVAPGAAAPGIPQGGPAGMPAGGNPGPRARIPGQRQQPADMPPGSASASGPRQAYLEAFTEVDDVFAPGQKHRVARGPEAEEAVGASPTEAPDVPEAEAEETRKGSKGRTFTGIAAAAVTTVLAVVVAGQVTDDRNDTVAQSQAEDSEGRDIRDDSASRTDSRPAPSESPSATPLTYDEKMDQKNTLAADLAGSGKFAAVGGLDQAPGTGQKFRYRVDVEEGIGLDAELFAEAVQKTLNDDRGWAHNGGRTFERISSGTPDFVITLASPGTTAEWCAKSGLDTTVDNVSCDSAATERVMINAYRWAQGAETYGDKIHAYRQMLINHEIGHRLGYGHVTCDKDGDLAPVMQQQTKFLNHDGIRCRANPWPYPG